MVLYLCSCLEPASVQPGTALAHCSLLLPLELSPSKRYSAPVDICLLYIAGGMATEGRQLRTTLVLCLLLTAAVLVHCASAPAPSSRQPHADSKPKGHETLPAGAAPVATTQDAAEQFQEKLAEAEQAQDYREEAPGQVVSHVVKEAAEAVLVSGTGDVSTTGWCRGPTFIKLHHRIPLALLHRDGWANYLMILMPQILYCVEHCVTPSQPHRSTQCL